MEHTLFIEMYENSLMMYMLDQNAKFQPVDISGGYGKLHVSFNVLKGQDQIFIGEDALQFDVDDQTEYIEHVMTDGLYLDRYMETLIDKIRDYSPYKEIHRMVIIDCHHHGMEDFRMRHSQSFNGIQVTYVTHMEAAVGYGCLKKQPVSIIDEKHIYTYETVEENQQCSVTCSVDDVNVHDLELEYLEVLIDAHGRELTQEPYQVHQLRRLYDAQKNSFRKLHLGEPSINIYSSVLFPPKKIKVTKEQVIDKFKVYLSSFEKWKTMEEVGVMTGRVDILSWTLDDRILSNFEVYNGALSEGARHFLNQKAQGVELLKARTLGYAIGIMNDEFEALLFEDAVFSKEMQVNILTTDYEHHVQLMKEKDGILESLGEIELETKNQYQRISLFLTFDDQKELVEVRHEFGRL